MQYQVCQVYQIYKSSFPAPTVEVAIMRQHEHLKTRPVDVSRDLVK